MNIVDAFSAGSVKVIVKPNVSETRIVGYDKDKQAFRIDLAARPENNEANIELVKFLSRLLKKKVKIKTGLRSKEKLVSVL